MQLSSIALFLLLAPLALAAAAALSVGATGQRRQRALRASLGATIAALTLGIGAAVLLAVAGATTSEMIGIGEVGLSVRVDALSVLMVLLVSFVGLAVVSFSRNYLAGDPGHGRFLGGLCLTLAAVLLLVTAGNLFQLVGGWIGTSLALHRLLVFYSERRGAIVAARKKFVTARLGDVCLVAAALLLLSAFGSSDIAAILSAAASATGASAPPGTALAAILIAVAALLKSAQFPTHGWLPEVMETPVPVSALLHAGIINAGGFIVLRLADVMVLAPSALYLLAMVGGFTALFGGIVMLTQPSVKASLAWSTVTQMGFMLLQCGLGAFSVAVLHIVAHALYKAHAFLSSGSIVAVTRATASAPPPVPHRTGWRLAGLGLALALYAGIGWAFGLFTAANAAILTLGAILVMGLAVPVAEAMRGENAAGVAVRIVAAVSGAAIAYIVLQCAAAWLMASVLPPPPLPDAPGLAIMALAVASFAAVTALQLVAHRGATSPTAAALRVHVANGFYANALFNRLVGATRRPAGHPHL